MLSRFLVPVWVTSLLLLTPLSLMGLDHLLKIRHVRVVMKRAE